MSASARRKWTLRSATAAAMCWVAAASWADNGLTPTENRWIEAASPVLDYAASQGLPIDIIVQPQTGPSDVPLAMGFDNGHCKLVLTLRDNPDAESALQSLTSEQQTLAIEAMVAHEVAHCWRRIDGDWHTLPAGFSSSQTAPQERVEQTRREEGLADLFGLAWTLERHRAEYSRIHAWFKEVRENQVVPGSHHDTRSWIDMARSPTAFDATQTPFEQARSLWIRGLNDDAP